MCVDRGIVRRKAVGTVNILLSLLHSYLIMGKIDLKCSGRGGRLVFFSANVCLRRGEFDKFAMPVRGLIE